MPAPEPLLSVCVPWAMPARGRLCSALGAPCHPHARTCCTGRNRALPNPLLPRPSTALLSQPRSALTPLVGRPRMHGAGSGAAGQDRSALARELEAARQELQAERKKREAERAGRVRAEAQLRKRIVGAPTPDDEPGSAGHDSAAAGGEEGAEAAGRGGAGAAAAAAGVAGGVQAPHGGSGGGVEMKVIGRMRSCFRRRFGAPRQGSVVAGSRGMLRMTPECNAAMSTDSLDQYSHVWLIYVFHENTNLGRCLARARSTGTAMPCAARRRRSARRRLCVSFETIAASGHDLGGRR